MYKKDVLAHFERISEVAKVLGISVAAISQWGDVIPEKNAYRLQAITNNQLKIDERLYRFSTDN
ncbi:Cro/CI family transcriptional regulator [Bisgaard Taxon 45]